MRKALEVYSILNSKHQDVKYTTRKPIQLPTTPTALYELMNINGKNSYLLPKMMPWNKEQ